MILWQASVGKGEIFFDDGAVLELALEGLKRLLRLGDDHETGYVLIETVHDARASFIVSHFAHLMVQLQKRVYDRWSLLVFERFVHQESGGLVDDQEIVVLVDDIQDGREAVFFVCLEFSFREKDYVAFRERAFGFCGFAIHQDGPCVDEPLDLRTRRMHVRNEKEVESASGFKRRDKQFRHSYGMTIE